jgi:hypothetical protein
MRMDLAERLLPLAQPMILRAAAALETLRVNPDAPGPVADRTREAFKVHFLGDDRLSREGQFGQAKRRFDDIRVNLDHRNLLWRDATIRRAKIELNVPKTVNLPAIYINFDTRASTVFTPNYKPLDVDGLGFGPQMLVYTLIVGLAKQAVGHDRNKPVLHSDTPGYPGPSLDAALVNPAAYGGFAFQLHMGFALPLGDSTRKI